MLEIDETKIYGIPERFVLHKLDDEMYWLFDIKDGDYFKLNLTTYSILMCFDGKTPLFKIKEQLISRHPEVNTQVICNDLEELTEKLVKEGILKSF